MTGLGFPSNARPSRLRFTHESEVLVVVEWQGLKSVRMPQGPIVRDQVSQIHMEPSRVSARRVRDRVDHAARHADAALCPDLGYPPYGDRIAFCAAVPQVSLQPGVESDRRLHAVVVGWILEAG